MLLPLLTSMPQSKGTQYKAESRQLNFQTISKIAHFFLYRSNYTLQIYNRYLSVYLEISGVQAYDKKMHKRKKSKII